MSCLVAMMFGMAAVKDSSHVQQTPGLCVMHPRQDLENVYVPPQYRADGLHEAIESVRLSWLLLQ